MLFHVPNFKVNHFLKILEQIKKDQNGEERSLLKEFSGDLLKFHQKILRLIIYSPNNKNQYRELKNTESTNSQISKKSEESQKEIFTKKISVNKSWLKQNHTDIFYSLIRKNGH